MAKFFYIKLSEADMKNFKQVTIYTDKLESVFCNLCGSEIKKNQFGYFDDYLSVNKTWDYDSNFDGLTHSFDLCQNCYKNLIAQMKIKPGDSHD